MPASCLRATDAVSATADLASFTIIIAAAADAYFANVKLLMGFNGSDAATGSPGMSDESSAARGVPTVFGAAQIDTAQSVFGGSSLLLDGSSGYLSYPDHADWHLSNQPFTIECRFRATNVSGQKMLMAQWGLSGCSWRLWLDNNNLQLVVSTTGSDNQFPLTTTVAANTWYAVAVEFDGTKYRMYINGAMVNSSTTLYTVANGTVPFMIGSFDHEIRYYFNGWIDELRITKGTARYASDAGYTVATSEFPRS